VARRVALVTLALGNRSGGRVSQSVTLRAENWNTDRRHTPAQVSAEVVLDGALTTTTVELPLGADALLWDEWSPALYRLTATLGNGDALSTTFGLREMGRLGTQFAVNGKATFLRGTHNAASFPKTLHPPMDLDSWLALMRLYRSYGLNHYRCHTWAVPEAALLAADMVGLYIQPELPSWGGFQWANDAAHDAYCRREALAMSSAWANHPSFAMFALGNEIGLPRAECRAAMTALVSEMRADDPTRLYAEGSNNEFGNPTVNPGDDYFTTFRTGRRTGAVRGSFATVDKPEGHIQVGPANTRHDYAAAITGIAVPVVGHEVGQYTVFPDLAEIGQATGATRLRNYEIVRDGLTAAGRIDRAAAYTQASGQVALRCYREEIEAALRTPGFGGFQLLDLIDNQEQGTAVVGILDAGERSKGLITPEAWREFCAETVLLARFDRYTWAAGETFSADVEVAHYGPQALTRPVLEWSLSDGATTLAHGALPPRDVPQGSVTALGRLTIPLPMLPAARRLELVLSLRGTNRRNRYELWVYPPPASAPPAAGPAVTVRHGLDEEALRRLSAGDVVVVLPPREGWQRTVGGAFATDFWCWPMFHNEPGTMGLLIDAASPALAGFPTAGHGDWQWFDIARAARPVILDGADLRPAVEVIDNFARLHHLGLLFELRVGPGRLLVSAVDLPAMGDQPAPRALWSSLLAYAASDRFHPTVARTPEQALSLLAPVPPNLARGGRASASTEQGDATAGKALDGNPETRWCAVEAMLPQWWQVDLGAPQVVSGLTIDWEYNRRLYGYLIEGSDDGATWRQLSDQRANPSREQVHAVAFAPATVRFVRVTVVSTERQWASIREVRVTGP
ncbi:MAG: discoidin domain-containing protein, partial [Armatimonadetes bacterium]|nr:discoidin domain-containing protein [Armatimonadota bacterium]